MLRIRLLKLGFAFVVIFFSLLGNAWAFHGHIGVIINPWLPLYYPYVRPYYYPPAYYPPAYFLPVVIHSPPPVYIEPQLVVPSAAPEINYWYYCPVSKAYYPYVKSCKVGWQKVLPQQQ